MFYHILDIRLLLTPKAKNIKFGESGTSYNETNFEFQL